MTARLVVHWHDAHLIIAEKPAGLLSVPGRGPDKTDCAAARIAAQFPDALTVHRLDMATSGLLLFARNKPVQAALSGLFQRGDVDKTYLADVAGCPPQRAGRIDLPLIADWPNRPLQKVDHVIGKPSCTDYEVLRTGLDASRLRLTPRTGRSHQLRVHLASIDCPILGDEFYAPPNVKDRAPRLCLHAHGLDFTHPVSGEAIKITSPCPF
jgi:tRNA pseudouridine32 synthase / 23S rRNA pseudouridine746 synthase